MTMMTMKEVTRELRARRAIVGRMAGDDSPDAYELIILELSSKPISQAILCLESWSLLGTCTLAGLPDYWHRLASISNEVLEMLGRRHD